ncbi:uncharacterized protein A1O9_04596 [Exophiala aquamarina CBS 119918]|uniref:BTB domain-containing protein n=1 Tax=Exophiala aquamarina CBS 119918 TaxID=1182545 RepID=A0A072PKB1_9EURO|nr:uncharacterized protein A1O9_04596 [Exophiala aquamarina CBS 119918]KEF59748.1 hypothetical protein A1O9_04596 [Exophiala aquamarina CBS 119918]
MANRAYLMESSNYADLTIISQGVEFQVHRSILSIVPYFKALCEGGFQQEAEVRTSDLSDHHPAIISRILFYLYTGDLEEDQVPTVYKDRVAEIDLLLPASRLENRKRDCNGKRVKTNVDFPHLANRLMLISMVYRLADMLGMEDLKDTPFFPLPVKSFSPGILISRILPSVEHLVEKRWRRRQDKTPKCLLSGPTSPYKSPAARDH